jgi:hypothetical protein
MDGAMPSAPGMTGDDPELTGSVSVESDALRAALAGGDIDYDKYIEGYRRFSTCMRAAGFPLTMESENNLVMDFAVVGEAVFDGTEAECYEREFAPLDIAWQLHQEDTSESAEILRQCLIKRGIVPEATVAAMTEQMSEEGIPLEDCLAKDE